MIDRKLPAGTVFPDWGQFDFNKASGVRGDISVFDKSMARQEFAAECDINTIMAKYEAGGAVTHVNRVTPVYMDVTAVPDLRGALDAMREATVAFSSLPARVRREFDNDPQKFVDYAQDGANLQQMRDWGLAPLPAAPVEPLKVEVINPANSNEAPQASSKAPKGA